jgi:hypothetical protein
MMPDLPPLLVHPSGDLALVDRDGLPADVVVDSYAGRVHVGWDSEAALTPLGQLPFFIDFLKASGLFDRWVLECPLVYSSPNAPKVRDILGTTMLSILSGHWRYAHISALRGDGVLPDLLGMRKVASEDSVRRAFLAVDEAAGTSWLQRHLDDCTRPVLGEPWILDMDTSVKLLYGHQEGAVLGYNPHKPGRPSHSYHTYFVGNLRLVLDVDVHAGNEHASNFSAPGLWGLLDRLGRGRWPALLRGDAGFGNDPVMREAEQRGLPYLFKLRLSANVKRAAVRAIGQDGWADAGHGWQGKRDKLRLSGWSWHRQVVILRRRRNETAASEAAAARTGQLQLAFTEIGPDREVWEYAVLVTSLDDEILTLGQLYRDRGDGENNFDELKNQWGWAGFTTHDLKRCRLMARTIALVYNWWNLFVRLADPDSHREAITSRPLFLHAIAAKTRHAGQTRITISSSHAKARWSARVLAEVASFLQGLAKNAEQLTQEQRWYRILSQALRKFLNGRQLHPPPRLFAT